ncbi:hypothetical protein ABZU76_33700 [Amycolatopsis sp. NPDC005232]|uniref:hypothetical protein n=1 Tax=Amycolatopsis sp. NPDC005232 TaxID=3157027 RepID=UPI0033BCFF56
MRDRELKDLLATTAGKSFVQLRDRAIMLVLIDCGLGLGELCAVRPAHRLSGSGGVSDAYHTRPRESPMPPLG